MDKFRILGAGLAGLLAGCKWPKATIYEARPRSDGPNHKALLRFRSEEVSKLTGIPFREIEVQKAIYSGKVLRDKCSIDDANAYARKVVGRVVGARSIWNLDSERRWVAPHDLEEQLIARHEGRIAWNFYVFSGQIEKGTDGITISTIPMPAMLETVGLEDPPSFDFDSNSRPIFVRRYKLPEGTEVYQTIYFPDDNTSVYRASITGDMLIIEESSYHWACSENSHTTGGETSCNEYDDGFDMVIRAFGFGTVRGEVKFIDCKTQRNGKIVELPREQREAVMYELTRDYNIFSLGRFATWRNILLDDVVKDMEFIDRLMNASVYGRHKLVARGKSVIAAGDDDYPF